MGSEAPGQPSVHPIAALTFTLACATCDVHSREKQGPAPRSLPLGVERPRRVVRRARRCQGRV